MGVEIPAGLTQKQDYEAGGDVEKKKKKKPGLWTGTHSGLLPALPPPGRVASGRLLHLSGPQSPQLSSALTAASTAGVVGGMK